MSEEKAKELGVTPMATWVAGALGGVEPEIMGVGPVASTRKVLAKTGLSIDDMTNRANRSIRSSVYRSSKRSEIRYVKSKRKRWCNRIRTPGRCFRMPYPCYITA